ncbi:MAG: ABC transporter substrate-binding protein [Chloroflexota bacterium]|jgi:branched-chain amino acid transport system substrate-binding protein
MKVAAKSIAILALIGGLLALLGACSPAPATSPSGEGSPSGSNESQPPIVIGLVTEVTGPQAGTGDNQTNGISLAFDEVNEKGGINGRKIQLVIEDDLSTPPGAVNAYNKIIAEQKPVATFIPNFANFDMAIEPAIRKAGIPAITGASGTGVTAAGNPWIFRVRTNDDIMGRLAAEYAVKEMGAKKIGILYVTGEMGAGASKVVKETLEQLGAAPVAIESYNMDDKDVTAQLLNIQKAGAELVIGWSYPPDAAMIMTNMNQLGLNMKLLGSPAYGIADSLKLAREAANGHTVIVDWAPSDDPVTQEWVKKIEARAKLPANFIQSVYYDGANILAHVLEQSGTDPKAIQDGLRSLKGYKGITGEYTFDEQGNGLRQAYVGQIKDGKVDVIKTVKGQ